MYFLIGFGFKLDFKTIVGGFFYLVKTKAVNC